MKKSIILVFIIFLIFGSCLTTTTNSGQNPFGNNFQVDRFSIPPNAELLESTEFKHDGEPYMIEQRFRLPSGEILYAYWDLEGSSSVTIQRIEETPLLALGADINIAGMPGYREFNF